MALAVVAVLVGLTLGAFSPIAAQERDIEGQGDAAKVRISDVANENRIDRAVIGMLIIAVGMALLTLLFWWHTQPARRARVLAARAGPAPVPDEVLGGGDVDTEASDLEPDDPVTPAAAPPGRINEGVSGG